MKLEFSLQIIQKNSNIKFHENPSSESGWMDRRTDMTKPIVCFRIFKNTRQKETTTEDTVNKKLMNVNWSKNLEYNCHQKEENQLKLDLE
jgi:hypothetical protein